MSDYDSDQGSEKGEAKETLGSSDALFDKLKKWFKSDYDSMAQSNWRREAREDFAFEAGDQLSADDKAILKDMNRPIVVFNRVGPVVDSVAGQEVGNRQEVQFVPRTMGAVKVNELMTSAAKWFRQECDAEDEESDAFRDMIVCGMGWCLSDDAMVRLPNTHFATTRLYSGVVIDIDLENGQRLTGTANHPVLTDEGWKGLHALKEGDNLVNAGLLERVEGFPVEQFDKVETRLKDKIDAFRTGRESLRFVTAADDFYSDGAGSKVHVVYADRSLLNKIRNSSAAKAIQDQALAGRHLLSRVGVSLLGGGLLLRASQAAEQLAAFCRIHAPRLHLAGRNILSQLMTGGAKSFAHCLAVQSNPGADLIDRHFSFEVEPHKFIDRGLGHRAAVPFSQGMAGRAESCGNNGVRYSNLISDFFDWKPILEVEARKLCGGDGVPSEFVTRVKRRIVRNVRDFPVHDVGTSLGMFVAGSIITSNTETRLDYEDNPAGDPKIERTDPLEMVWDSSAKKRNLADKRRVFHIRRDVPIDEARALCPGDFEDGDYNASWVDDVDSEDGKDNPHDNDGKFYNKGDNTGGDDSGDNCVTLVRAQWWEYAPAWLMVDPANPNNIKTLNEQEYRLIEAKFKMAGAPMPKVVKSKRKVYRQAYLGSELLEVGDAPCKDHFSFQAMTGKRDRNKNTFYGLVRAMKDPARWSNKWMSQTMHIMNSTSKGGIAAERGGFFDNDADGESSWAKSETVTYLKPGALSGQNPKFIAKPTSQFPQSSFELMQYAVTSLRDVSGVNVEILGMQQGASQAAQLDLQRKQSALTILQPLFDSLRRYRKSQGRLLLYLIENYLSDGRLVKIVGQDDAQYVPLIKQEVQSGNSSYDVIVDESPTSANQKEATWAMLQQLLPVIGKMLPPATWLALLKYSPLPTTAQKEISDSIQQSQQQAAQQPDPEQQKADNEIRIAQAKGQTEVQTQTALTHAKIQGMAAESQAKTAIAAHSAASDAAVKAMTAQQEGAQKAAESDKIMTAISGMQQQISALVQALQGLQAPQAPAA